MTQATGWWRFDEAGLQLVRRDTAQAIQCLGASDDDASLGMTSSVNRRWQRFAYRDSELTLPLLVEWRSVPSEKFGRPLVWRVDYVRTAALWRREGHIDTPFPSYGLWRRVDDCVADGLPCWPKETNPRDLAKRTIALNGGWLNGAWTASLYRSIWGASGRREDATMPTATLVPTGLAPPSPWQRCEDPAAVANLPVLERVPAILRAEVLAATGNTPYLLSADRTRILVPLPLLRPASYRVEDARRYFYADPHLATDAFHVGISSSKEHDWKEWSGYVERNTHLPIAVSAPARDRLLARALVSSRQASPRAFFDVRHALMRPLAQAFLDAWLTTGLWPTPPQGKPQTVFFIDWDLAGCTEPSRLEASADLDNPLNKLAVMFEESKDGVVRSGADVPARGWWDFDFDSKSLINRSSGERVRLLGAFDAGGVAHFAYEHDKIACCLHVRRDPSAGAHNPAWILDYERSLALRSERDDSPLRYGLWNRVDECMLDALTSWPELEETGPPPMTVVAVAGWLNGAWTPQLRRQRNHVRQKAFADNQPSAAAVVDTLDAAAPVWSFKEAARAIYGGALVGVVDLGGDRRWLPRESPLTGFEHHAPHTRRGDGQAVIFPSGLTSQLWRGESYHASAIFTYADEDVFFEVHACGISSAWFSFDLNTLSAPGLRDRGRFLSGADWNLPSEFFFESSYLSRPYAARLSLPLARRVTRAVIDAGLSWTGSRHRMLDDPKRFDGFSGLDVDFLPAYAQSGIGLSQPRRVTVEGGYAGGRYTRCAVVSAWLA